jgi:hypothetical protein
MYRVYLCAEFGTGDGAPAIEIIEGLLLSSILKLSGG